MISKKISLASLFVAVLVMSCSSSRYSLREPHLYNNNFDEVLESINDVLLRERMSVSHAEYADDNTYVIHFFKKSALIDERNFEYGATSTMTIKNVDGGKTSIRIEEPKSNALVKTDYRENIAKDLFEELNKIFNLQPKLAQK